MNKLTKIGVSALCGSLAGISVANAGDLSASGSAALTWMSKSDDVTGNPIGMASAVSFAGSGELDIGWTVDLSIALADGGGYSNTHVTIGVPGIGDIRVDQGVSGTGINRMDDMTPSAWEEADGAGLSAGINKVAGTSAGGTIEVTPSAYTPDGLTVRFAFAQDADSGQVADKNAGGSSGVLGSGWDLTLEASSDLTGVDGLTLYGGVSNVEQYQNASTYDGDVKETVYGFKYAVGGFTFGAQTSDEDTGATATASYDNIAYGITFQINDDLSVSYGHTESDNGATTAEADSIQASYTMGGATISIAEVEVNNATYSTASTADKDATIISLGLAF